MGERGAEWADETYRLTVPNHAGPFVFTSPHSGKVYPDDMAIRHGLASASLTSAEDALVDELIAPASGMGAVVISARIARAYVDLNRDPADLDPALIDGIAPDAGSARSRAGYGVLHRLSGDGQALYDRRLSLKEAQTRIERVHAPWRQTVQAQLDAARERCGRSVLIDWHSMPAGAAGPKGPDIVLGDRHGGSCRGDLTRRLRALFEAEGFSVGLNHPYAGGWATQHWGRPSDGVDALQVEISRTLYFDETKRVRNSRWDATIRRLTRIMAGLLAPDA